MHVKAVEAYLKQNGRLPFNVKFIIEGEEESGGASLKRIHAPKQGAIGGRRRPGLGHRDSSARISQPLCTGFEACVMC